MQSNGQLSYQGWGGGGGGAVTGGSEEVCICMTKIEGAGPCVELGD